ncbi:ATP-grasp domain-containing protein [Undibacterium sp. TS12]|uniref:ATP-grasp domain-containing protein n=1 Tax=Undibacterium sp. TS12 TaxID=2908202 RepID=UPI001F4C9B00|nr:ATP-grasp domain-containing protein [Undibacterium sp. TS12]MCH8622228.1 ATP-grasp domain-containing protein [Undibacterium sp. TS12]
MAVRATHSTHDRTLQRVPCAPAHYNAPCLPAILRFGELQRETEFSSATDEDHALETFMNTLLTDERVDLPAACVIDAGMLASGKWACVEQNAAWGAGIYGCDPAGVLEVLRHASVKT